MTAPPPETGRATPGLAANVVLLTVAGFDGAAISVQVRPTGGAVPVLLVHGFGSNGTANWSATGWLAGLERAGIATVTVDLRGHGLSAKPLDSRRYSLPIVVQDLWNVLAALPRVLGPVRSVDLVGYSMGGRVVGEVVAAAADSPHYRERAPWPPGVPSIRRAVIGGYDGRPLFDSVEFIDFRDALAGLAVPDGPGRRIATIALATKGNDPAALSALVQGLSEQSVALPARAVEVPTLVVAGELDEITDNTIHWAAGLPDGRHLVLPHRDHITAVTSGVFRSAALEFLRG